MDAFDDFQPLGEAGNPLTARFAYDDWANRTLLDAMLEIAEPPDVAVKRLAHVIGTWLKRQTPNRDSASGKLLTKKGTEFAQQNLFLLLVNGINGLENL